MDLKENLKIQVGHSHSQWLILLFFVLFQIPFLFRPIEGHHMSRQADTAAVARNLAFESFDPLRPRIDRRGDKSGIAGMEVPLYETVVAGGLSLAGDTDAVGKLVSLLAAVAAWIVLAKLLVRCAGVDPWAAQAALGASPILFIYSARIMPETFALLLAVVALERFDTHGRQKSQTALWTGTASLALAALTRPYVIFAGLPLLCFWLGEVRHRQVGFKYLAAGAGVAVPFLLWNFIWWPHLERAYGLDYFFRGYPFRETLAEMAQPAFWGSLLNMIIKYYLNWLCIPFATWGAIRLWRAKQRTPGASLMAFWLPAAAVPILCLIIGSHFVPHEYYFLSLVPWSVLLVAAGLSGLREWHPRLGIAACVLVAVLTPGLFWKFYRSDDLLPAYKPAAAEIAARTDKSELVLIEEIETTRGAWYLHPIRRRGWIEPRNQLYDVANVVELRQCGLRWVVWHDGHGYHLSDVESWVDRLGVQN